MFPNGLSAEDRERRDYLTRETGEVLHERARWLVLRNAPKLEFDLKRPNGQTVRITSQPPALVLFEWPDRGGQIDKDSPSCPSREEDAEDVLRMGFLVLDLYFAADGEVMLADLIRLNELFRFFLRPYGKHSDGGRPESYRQVLADLPRNPLDPSGKRLGEPAATPPELACYLERWEAWLRCPVIIGGEWYHLMPEAWFSAARDWALGKNPRTQSHGWLAHADNRCYVWTCAVVQECALLEQIKNWSQNESDTPPACLPPEFGPWIHLLNVDSPDDSVTPFERRWAAARTYTRWAHFGSLQGFCSHAGAMLTGCSPDPPTWRHFRDMYFDQALLLLYIRAVLFRFSFRLSWFSQHAVAMRNDSNLFLERFHNLREQFTHFTNMYQFPLLSTQQQALELYELLRANLDVTPLFEEVKEEVETTDEFLSSQQQGRIADSSLRLTVVATMGFVATLVLGFFGADYLLKPFFGESLRRWLALVLILLSSIGFFLLILDFVRRSKSLDRLFNRVAQSPNGALLDRLDDWLELRASRARREKPPEPKRD